MGRQVPVKVFQQISLGDILPGVLVGQSQQRDEFAQSRHHPLGPVPLLSNEVGNGFIYLEKKKKKNKIQVLISVFLSYPVKQLRIEFKEDQQPMMEREVTFEGLLGCPGIALHQVDDHCIHQLGEYGDGHLGFEAHR